MCRNAPNGAAQPSVNHDLLNEAVPQILDTHEAYDAAAGVLFHIATAPVEAAALGRLGALAKGAIAARRIGLPAWGKITVNWIHIAERHVAGGPFTAGRTIFPNTMSSSAIARAIRTAWGNAAKIEVQGIERVRLRGYGGGLTIDMWFNKVTNMIETAYPVFP